MLGVAAAIAHIGPGLVEGVLAPVTRVTVADISLCEGAGLVLGVAPAGDRVSAADVSSKGLDHPSAIAAEGPHETVAAAVIGEDLEQG